MKRKHKASVTMPLNLFADTPFVEVNIPEITATNIEAYRILYSELGHRLQDYENVKKGVDPGAMVR